ncbi:hypothetical protein ASG40_11630 [Methylobacterium sp. Leaf399]|uniref:hypothetical protein n=1 Tax=Methylobacterium sp. Leaf399 TaxID=1736364 RepID=UPI0006FADDEF|nr:hypothetical protein [Methylobacterium sp. Leaf399]KQT08522.1 hypothetical protein ASG40_11630 [Methylobacterium sp. Leaf399]
MRAFLVVPGRLAPKAIKEIQARPAPLAQRGQLVLLGRSERLEMLVPQESLVLRAQRVLLAPRVPPGHRAQLAL